MRHEASNIQHPTMQLQSEWPESSSIMPGVQSECSWSAFDRVRTAHFGALAMMASSSFGISTPLRSRQPELWLGVFGQTKRGATSNDSACLHRLSAELCRGACIKMVCYLQHCAGHATALQPRPLQVEANKGKSGYKMQFCTHHDIYIYIHTVYCR